MQDRNNNKICRKKIIRGLPRHLIKIQLKTLYFFYLAVFAIDEKRQHCPNNMPSTLTSKNSLSLTVIVYSWLSAEVFHNTKHTVRGIVRNPWSGGCYTLRPIYLYLKGI